MKNHHKAIQTKPTVCPFLGVRERERKKKKEKKKERERAYKYSALTGFKHLDAYTQVRKNYHLYKLILSTLREIR